MAPKVNESEDELKKRFKELVSDLNLDKGSAEDAWISYQRIGINYTLEGDQLHWLSCAVYVACRKCITQTVGKVVKIEGNLVSLTRLLKSCKLSLVQFFNKMKKWSDMANLSAEMRQKIDHLERNFNVSTVIFKKYKPIFEDVFKDPIFIINKMAKNRKQSRKQLVTSSDIFSFCWTLFIHIKSNFPQISDDLVNSYHLLLACIDYCFSNALLAENSKELLNSNFSEISKYLSEDGVKIGDKTVCIIQALCDEWHGISVEAKTIKEHWCKPCIKRMLEKDNFKTKNSGTFDVNHYENNYKHIMKEYDQYVLNIGDFDERIFLNDNASEELGTPQSDTNDLAELMQSRQSSRCLDNPNPNSLVPTTPLTNRHYLSHRQNNTPMTPIASATNSVSRLQSILLNRKDEPNETLESIFKQCIRNPREKILNLLKIMGDKFLTAYNNDTQSPSPASRMLSTNEEMGPPSPTMNTQNDEFAKKRLRLAISFYYKSLENILMSEKKRIASDKLAESLTNILEKDIFHLSLFACSVEIILFSYNAKQTFPWILEVFSDSNDLRLHAFNFYKVIEPIIREEDSLSRDVVKHLNSVEEQILESMAWKSDSPLWELIRSNGTVKPNVPSCAEVSLPMNSSGNTPSVLNSPVSLLKRTELQSNMGSISDRFSSPYKSTAKRQLFGSTKAETPTTSTANITQTGHIVQMMIPTKMDNGGIQYIQVPAIAFGTVPQQNNNSPNETAILENVKPLKSGPIGLFFRKVYTMAGLRLRDLCDRLNIGDEDIRKKIWTCFEHSLIQHTDLMRDRHLDQIIMCAFYAICKVTKQSQTFQEIMKCYRLQPQAASHVYRSVLMNSVRRRRHSGSSDTSRNSGSSSPLMQEERDRIRSSSTLPVPHPNSQPPTPTRVAGTGSQFEFEERGDVIMFYNNIFLPELTVKYIMKFSPNISESPPLSPLPRLNASAMSPYRRISQRFPLYISPLKSANFPPSPNRPMSYRFQSSPAKDLRAINNMMRSGSVSQRVSKRIFQDDVESENSPTKRQCTDTMNRKIRDIVTERQSLESNGSLNSNGNIDNSND